MGRCMLQHGPLLGSVKSWKGEEMCARDRESEWSGYGMKVPGEKAGGERREETGCDRCLRPSVRSATSL